MTRKEVPIVGLDRLEAALDTYGADRSRWPAPLRLALSGLIASNSEAQKLLKDAEALDRLLDRAPRYEMARLDKLRDRILAAAERQPRLVVSGRRSASPPVAYRQNVLAATALAASLVLGILAGQSNVVSTAADSLLGNDGSGSASASRQIAQSDEAASLLDEDLL